MAQVGKERALDGSINSIVEPNNGNSEAVAGPKRVVKANPFPKNRAPMAFWFFSDLGTFPIWVRRVGAIREFEAGKIGDEWLVLWREKGIGEDIKIVGITMFGLYFLEF